MDSNVEKEKKEFEKEYKEIQKQNTIEKKNEDEEIFNISKRVLRQMNIIIYSKNKIPENFISSLCETKDLKNNELYGVNIKIGKNPEKKEYLYKFVENGNEEKLEAISKDITKEGIEDKNSVCIDNVIVTLSENLMSPEIDELLNYFSKIPQKYQPFYLHLTLSEKEPNIEVIYNKIVNYKKMDKRNFYTMKYEALNDDIYLKFINQLNKFFSYYNELGDINIMEDDDQQFVARLNILVCGRGGAGKSTLINKILDEKRCREGSGQSITKFITFYNHKKYPLTIFDTPGFENEKTINDVVEVIKRKNKECQETKQQIHLIFYIFEYGTRTFFSNEKNILKELSNFGCKIFFIVSKSKFRLEEEEFEDQQLSVIEDVKTMCKETKKEEITRLFGNNFCDLAENYIFPINCKKEKKNDEEFGLDRLFLKSYEIFEKEKIPIDILVSLKNGSEEKVEELLSKYLLFKVYKSRKDIIMNAKTQAMKKILKFAIYSPFLVYVPSFGKANNIHRIYLAMISSIAKVYARKLSKEEALKLVNNSLENKKEEIEKNGTNTKFDSFIGILGSICAVIAWEVAIVGTLIGGSIIGMYVYKKGKKINEQFSKELEQTIPLYLFLQSISFNKGIDSLKEIYNQNKECDQNTAAPPLVI